MTKPRRFIYRDRGIRPKNSYELSFSNEMLAMFQLKHKARNPANPEHRRRVCQIFGLIIKLANRYLPPKQRQVFYSVWVRSSGKMQEGILEFSRKNGENYITNYCNYYKALTSLKNIMAKIGYDNFIIEYLRETDGPHEEN